ncbi:hypothetical protein LTR02_005186 [Friedmanniomyces endolithicus]|nr:hypothetical protein LTR94_007309 [Friedmanniomyces endolithicus]KAK0793858.1 hypothetical protein LTR59_008000 [Friedmanniomyces endolithicus]KAK0807607.1 hypothetical protein LTR38_004828 [Friedmanniomyces endolithicus]KAK0863927.1 hypothetical protein LTS02_006318 [Friedmanniomyces endolithicus]KAK0907996.1 hypothetical protein LTR02_005186 [Friedmanniomyces endolithicus]
MLSPAYATTVRLLIASLLLHGAAGQEIQDQINNFCRRFAHQTTVIGNRLYIDGGLLDYGGSISASTVNYTNTLLSYLDLDSLLFYLYGGEHNWTSQPPAQYTLWAYDAVYDVWNDTKQDASASGIQSVSFGAGTVVGDDRALGFYYGRWLSNATVLGWNGNAIA